jgi:SAM-dependent methyltransferase
MQPFPTVNELSDHFAVAYYRDVELEAAIADDKAPRYRSVFKALAEFCPNSGKLLDVGCAHGYGLDVAKSFGWTPFGIEIDDEVLKHLESRGYEVEKGTSIADWQEAQLLDAVLYMDVLYYFDNPYMELLEAHGRLVPGGWLVVRVSVWARLVMALCRMSEIFLRNKAIKSRAVHYLCDHIIEFSEKGFEQLLAATGYEIQHKSVDWGAGWRAGNSFFAILYRKTSELFSDLTGIRITPSLHYIARKR